MRGIFRFRGRRGTSADESTVILSDRQHELLSEEASLLDRLSAVLTAFPATDEDREELRRAAEQLGAAPLEQCDGDLQTTDDGKSWTPRNSARQAAGLENWPDSGKVAATWARAWMPAAIPRRRSGSASASNAWSSGVISASQ